MRDHHQQHHRTDGERDVGLRKLRELRQERRPADAADEHHGGCRRRLHREDARRHDGRCGHHDEVGDQQRDHQARIPDRLDDAGDGQSEAHGGHAADNEHQHRDLGDHLERVGEHSYLPSCAGGSMGPGAATSVSTTLRRSAASGIPRDGGGAAGPRRVPLRRPGRGGPCAGSGTARAGRSRSRARLPRCGWSPAASRRSRSRASSPCGARGTPGRRSPGT